MKLLTIAKSKSNNSIIQTGLIYGFIIWAILEIPFLIISYHQYFTSRKSEIIAKRLTAQKLLIENFQRESRFGDFVNARGAALKLGKILGLKDLSICQLQNDIIPNFKNNRCKKSIENIYTQSFQSSIGPLELGFHWEDIVIQIDFLLIKSLLITALLALIIVFSVTIIISNIFSIKIKSLRSQLEKIEGPEGFSYIQSPLSDLNPIIKSLNELAIGLDRTQRKNLELSINSEVLKMANQVSHDIRSPLTALSIGINDCKEINENDRIIIRTQINRITDIANQLLLKNRRNDHTSNLINNLLLTAIIEESISEKRLEYRHNLNISIEGFFNNAYGVFARVNSNELKTILSNTINNSVQAFKENKGKIKIYLKSENDIIKISVIDDGIGMPPEVLKKLGQLGFSHGKKDNKSAGSGIGVASAIEKVRNEWNGEISYTSKKGEGTTMTISLPKQDPPSWFLPELKIKNNTIVVCLDDDEGIHGIWSKRLNIKSRFVTLSTPNQLRNWVETESIKYMSIIYLCDYELLNFKESGLDLIENLKLVNASLVTSHYAETDIMKRCEELGVQLIPKMLAGSIPIIKEEKFGDNESFLKYNIVHLDDDRYLRRPWQIAAKKANFNILSVSNEAQLFSNIDKVSKTANFYLDESLGDGHIRGQEVAKKLFNLGFRNIYMATGYDASKFEHLKFISGVVGKEPVIQTSISL